MPVTVALPPVDDLSDLAITFKFYKEGANYVWNGTNLENNLLGSIKVGVLEDSNDLSSFVTLAHLATNETWTRYTVRLARYHGQGKVIAFRGYKMYPNSDSDTDFVYMHIDSIDIHPATGCGGVDWVDNSQVTNTKATIRWNDPERVGNFRVSLMGDGVDTTIVTTDTVVTFTGLIPGTDYTGRLYGLCSSSDSSTIIFYVSTYGGLIPDSITVSDITPHSAKVSWVPQGEETRWYAYVTDSNGISSTGLIECDTAELELTNLEGSMRYTIKISPNLGVWGQMLWSDTVGFTTLDPCAPKPLPYTENFNDVFDAQEVHSGYLPECWDYIWDGDLSWLDAPHISTGEDYYYPSPDGSPLLLLTASRYEGYDDTTFVLMPRVADTLNRLVLRFWYGHERMSYGALSVGYMVDGNYVNYMDMAPTTGRHTSIGLPSLPDEAERIAFRWVYGGNQGASVALDNIELVPADSTILYTVNAVCDSTLGEVVGNGVYEEDSWCDIFARPVNTLENGKQVEFDRWDDGSTENPRKVLVVSDTIFTALFRVVENNLGIGKIDNSKIKIEIYPNPTHGDVTIRVDEPAMLSIVDMTGRELVPPTEIKSIVTIRGSILSVGAYFVRITNEKGSEVRKLIKK